MATNTSQNRRSVICQALSKAFFSIYSYTIIYALFGVMSSSYHACFNSSLSTLEKRYHFSSSTGGLIMITDNIATVLTNLFIGYYGKTAHKPRWMSIGCVVTGFSVMITALPYFIYGAAQDDDLDFVGNMTLSTKNRDTNQLCYVMPQSEDCTEVAAGKTMTIVAVACFAISNFFRGFGTSIYFTYGTPYLDDNVSKAKMPTFFAFIFAARICGAPIGYLLSSTALKFYEDPFSTPPDLKVTDPRWIGAWWIGFLVTGCLLLLLSIPLSMFPREFKKKPTKTDIAIVELNSNGVVTEHNQNENIYTPANKSANDGDGEDGAANDKRRQTKDKSSEDTLDLKKLPGEILEIITNPIVACQMMGNLFRGIGIIGYFVFQTKYLESQFRQSASKASLVSGTTGFLAKTTGVLFGGLLITLCRPGPRALTTFIFLVELTSVFTLMYGASVIGPQLEYPHTTLNDLNELDLNNHCNKNCSCDFVRYQPVCEHQGNKAYFSPCHAGCKLSMTTLDNSTHFLDCPCSDSDTGTLEVCKPDTESLLRYVTIVALGGMISGSSRSGNMVTFFRSIRPDQKSLAVAVGSFWHSLFVAIPYPLLYGKIFDYCCLYWSTECGKRGNCWLYDTEKLRYIYHAVSIALIALGSVFDFIMIFLSSRLTQLYDDDGKKGLYKRFKTWLTKKKTKRSSSAAMQIPTINSPSLQKNDSVTVTRS